MLNISIIIPTKDEEKNLNFLLSDITNQSWNNLSYELIVADANSKDKTLKIAKKFNANIVQGGIPSIGRNNGAKIAKGKILFFLDADVRIKNKNFFYKSYKEFLKKRLDCSVIDNYPIIPKGINNSKKALIKFIFDFSNLFIRLSQKSKNPRANGTCIIFKKEVFSKLKGFNKKIYFGEDSEIVKRAVKKGYKFSVLNKKLYIHTSIRRVLKKGVLKYIKDVFILDFYRLMVGEINSKKLYSNITKIQDHFEK
ncbi:glycosyltransferase [Candidatus Woesearchaeota archaeon]|jgi:glycosyltransferase involved in cell wall biosynthesis|nr:glycosyltransferase [Candidatus Woesearchaeota archaeon]